MRTRNPLIGKSALGRPTAARNQASAQPSPGDDGAAVRRLEELRTALHRQDSTVYARLDQSVPTQPRLLVGDGSHPAVTVTPPLNGLATVDFRWGAWGARIAPANMPETAATAILAELRAGGEGR